MELNKIIQGDCLEVLKTLSENSVDSIVTDPPYELGFMGKSWDNTGIANNKEMWAECLRVLKPGGHLLAFSGTRTYHRMASAIEDAGFEVRDMIEWVYGSGFPKSLNIGKAVDKLQGNEREKVDNPNTRDRTKHNATTVFTSQEVTGWDATKGTSEWEGWGTALKPAHEPICMARKPLAEKTVAENVLKYGTGGINIDESRVGTGREKAQKQGISNNLTQVAGRDESNLKEHPEDLGRFPANFLHDGSEEVKECFPNESERFFKSIIYQAKASNSERNRGCEGLSTKTASELTGRKEGSRGMSGSKEHGNSTNPYANSGSVSPRANHHPTVKPIALMEYLIKMVTPKGGIVCERCYNGKYEKQKTNSETSPLPKLRDNIQAEGQLPQRKILHQEMCISGCEDKQGEELPILQKDIYSKENGQESTEILQPILCSTGYGNKKEGENSKNTERLFGDIQTREQNGEQTWNGNATQNCNGGENGEGFATNGDSSSHKSQKGRQQGREFNGNDSTGTQQNTEVKKESSVSSLSENRRCPNCGESMVKRAGVVLDPFAGSGSTLVAAKQNGFQYIGIELTEEYIPIIEARLKEVQSSLF